jgi:hypothetical protein
VSHCGALGVGELADGVFGFVQACIGDVVDGTVVCGVLVGVAVFLSDFAFGKVFVGVGAVGVVFGQFADRICVSPGAGCMHCVLSEFFGFTVVMGFSVVGVAGLFAVCAMATGDSEKAAAAIEASNIERFTSLLPNKSQEQNARDAIWCRVRELSSAISRPRTR